MVFLCGMFSKPCIACIFFNTSTTLIFAKPASLKNILNKVLQVPG